MTNVCPSIPNQLILNSLKKINITPISPISHKKTGLNFEGYDHILSFRRMMYINQEESSNLSKSIVIDYNQTLFRTFLLMKNSHALHVKL